MPPKKKHKQLQSILNKAIAEHSRKQPKVSCFEISFLRNDKSTFCHYFYFSKEFQGLCTPTTKSPDEEIEQISTKEEENGSSYLEIKTVTEEILHFPLEKLQEQTLTHQLKDRSTALVIKHHQLNQQLFTSWHIITEKININKPVELLNVAKTKAKTHPHILRKYQVSPDFMVKATFDPTKRTQSNLDKYKLETLPEWMTNTTPGTSATCYDIKEILKKFEIEVSHAIYLPSNSKVYAAATPQQQDALSDLLSSLYSPPTKTNFSVKLYDIPNQELDHTHMFSPHSFSKENLSDEVNFIDDFGGSYQSNKTGALEVLSMNFNPQWQPDEKEIEIDLTHKLRLHGSTIKTTLPVLRPFTHTQFQIPLYRDDISNITRILVIEGQHFEGSEFEREIEGAELGRNFRRRY